MTTGTPVHVYVLSPFDTRTTLRRCGFFRVTRNTPRATVRASRAGATDREEHGRISFNCTTIGKTCIGTVVLNAMTRMEGGSNPRPAHTGRGCCPPRHPSHVSCMASDGSGCRTGTASAATHHDDRLRAAPPSLSNTSNFCQRALLLPLLFGCST